MTDLIQTAASLSTESQQRLAVLAGYLIPADAEYGVPGADDDDIVSVASRLLFPAADAIAEILNAADGVTSEESAIACVDSSPAGMLIKSAICQAYYQDNRILASLAMREGPPFPAGNETREGDWSLLDPVRAKGKIYREV